MKGILQKLLQKRGIESVDKLSVEEKQTFDSWEKILSKEELTLEDVKQFCKSQIEVIKGKWSNLDTESVKKQDLIPYFVVYSTLLQAIDAPKLARESLEQSLTQLLNK